MDEFVPAKRPMGRPRKSPKPDEPTAMATTKKTPSGLWEVCEPGDNSRYLAHAMATRNMPMVDLNDPDAVLERIDWYLNHCVSADMKPTVKGFCNALNVSRQTLLNWRTGTFRAGTHEEIIVRAYDLLEEMWENYMLNGKINPTAGLFLGCNNFGYHDVRQVNLNPVTNNAPETVDPTIIEAKYAELPED